MSKKKNTHHYIDNKEFFKAMVEWKILVIEAENSGDDRPPITNYIGECFVNIAEHLSYKPNFINYEYREEMIGDGKEKKQSYVKFRMMEELDDGTISSWFRENYFEKDNIKKAMSDHFKLSDNDIEKFTPKKRKKKQKSKKKKHKKKNTLDSVLEDDKSEDSLSE